MSFWGKKKQDRSTDQLTKFGCNLRNVITKEGDLKYLKLQVRKLLNLLYDTDS